MDKKQFRIKIGDLPLLLLLIILLPFIYAFTKIEDFLEIKIRELLKNQNLSEKL